MNDVTQLGKVYVILDKRVFYGTVFIGKDFESNLNELIIM